MAGVDPEKKISRQVGWLNKNAGLQQPLSFSDVLGPLSGLDMTVAMSILKGLEAAGAAIPNPTQYVQAACQRAAAGLPAGAAPILPQPGFGAVAGIAARGAGRPGGLVYTPGPTIGKTIVGMGGAAGGSMGMPLYGAVPGGMPHVGMPPYGAVPGAAPAGLDADRKIARQVGWLNKNAALKEKISYSDVVGPLSSLDSNGAMKILKDLEENAANVQNPTGYVTAAATRASGYAPAAAGFGAPAAHPAGFGAPFGAPGPLYGAPAPLGAAMGYGAHGPAAYGQVVPGIRMGAPPQPVRDPTGKIARQVGWLNKNVFTGETHLSFSDVVDPLSCLEVAAAMKILKDVEENSASIKNPSNYVKAAAGRAAGAATPGFGAVGAFGAVGGAAPAVDATSKISRTVGWLNKNVSLTEQISFSDVVGPLSQIEVAVAMKILKDVETQADQIASPTQHILAAAAAALAEAGPIAEPAAAADPTGKIGRQVGWLNKNIFTAEPITFSEIVGPLSRIDVTEAMKILKELETAGPAVGDPTDYVTRRVSEVEAEGPEAAARESHPLDPTGKIERQVNWINKHCGLLESLSFELVLEPLSTIDIKHAMKVFKDLEEGGASIADPTGFVIESANNIAITGGEAGPSSSEPAGVKRKRKDGAPMAQNATPQDDEASKMISRQVGVLNSRGGLLEKISYSDVKEPLEACGPEAAMKILKDLEQSAGTVKSPTSYVLAAANRFVAGEGIPAKRTRGGPELS